MREIPFILNSTIEYLKNFFFFIGGEIVASFEKNGDIYTKIQLVLNRAQKNLDRVDSKLLMHSLFDFTLPNGHLVASSKDEKLFKKNIFVDPNQREWMKLAPKEPWTVHITEPDIGIAIDPKYSILIIPIGFGVTDYSNNFLGTISSGIFVDKLKTKLHQTLQSQNYKFIVLNNDLDYFFYSDKEEKITQEDKNELKTKLQYLKDKKENFGTLNETIFIDGTEYMFYTKASNYPFIVVIGINRHGIFDIKDLELRMVELEKEGKYDQMFLLALLYAFQTRIINPVVGEVDYHSTFRIPKIFSTRLNDLFLSLEQIENFMELKIQKDVSEELADERKKLLDLRDSFFANMNHELRTPLNSILGNSEIIMEKMLGKDIDDEYVKRAGKINNSGRRLLNLINDLLLISKINAKKFKLCKENTHLNEIIEQSIDSISLSAKKKNIKIITDFEEDFILSVDKLRIEQVFDNILSNAVKFTNENGEVKILVRDDVNYVEITIEDNGIGIKKENLEKILNEYEQVTDGHHRESDLQGTGLGLPIVKKIVELHEGMFSIDSVSGKGTKAKVRLPR